MVRQSPVPVGLLVHLRRARDVADRNYSEPLDLDALAATAGMSKYHFLRCFAAEYGETPMQYVTRRRIERAADLLRGTNLTVTEVCNLVGYSSLGSFSMKFRELVGLSPSDYQRTQAGGPHIPGCLVFMLGLQPAPVSSAGPGAWLEADAGAEGGARDEVGPDAGVDGGAGPAPDEMSNRAIRKKPSAGRRP